MASNYPSSLDAFTTGVLAGVVSGTDHGNKGDALNKIEAELGIDPSGTSATVKARLDLVESSRPVVVTDAAYGATGNGSTDDTTAINAAITAAVAGGGRGGVYFPPGTYRYSTIVVKSGAQLYGLGPKSILKPLNAGGRIENQNLNGNGSNIDTDIDIRFLKIDGNRANVPSANWYGILLANVLGFAIENLYITSCRRIGICLGGDSSDGNGLAERGVVRNVHVTDTNGVDGGSNPYGVGITVIRGERLVFDSCFSWSNGTHGFDIEPNQAADVARNITFRDCHAWSNSQAGFIFYNSAVSDNTLVSRNIKLLGCSSYLNSQEGVKLLGFTFVLLDGCHIYSNTLDGVWVGNYNEGLKIVNNTIYANGGNGIQFISGLYVGTVANNTLSANALYGIKNVAATSFTLRLTDNDILGNATGQVNLTWPNTNGRILRRGNHIGAAEIPTGLDNTVVAAATVTLPEEVEVVTVTGNTNITSITASHDGRRVTLIFTGTPTFTDGSNLKLAGNLVATADDAITLVCNGTNWYETGRSVN